MGFKKCFTLLFLLCVSMVCFFGCASVESFRTVTYDKDGNGVIIDRLVVTLDRKELGASYDAVRNAVYDDMITFRNYVYSWMGEFQEDYPELYLKLNSGISCDVPPTTESDNHILSVTLTFTGAYGFGVFYGVDGIEDEEINAAMKDVGPFLSNIISQNFKTEDMGLFLYKYAVLNTESLVKVIPEFKVDNINTNYYNKYSKLTNGDMSDIEVSQVFVFPTESFSYVLDDKVYHNADEVEEVDGHTFLYWNLTDKAEDFQISMYKIAPKKVIWYMVGLLISIAFVIILFVILKMKKVDKVKITKTEVEKDKDGR